MNKIRESAEEAVMPVQDGAAVMIGGFMVCGTPEPLVEALLKKGVKDLTVICNDGGYPGRGAGSLIRAGRVRKLIVSHVGLNPEVAERMNNGTLEVELVPQGTLAERIRAAGAGLGGVLTPTGVGTIVAQGKELIAVDGRNYLLEKPIRADFALLGASAADRFGNALFRGTMKNFNPLMGTAAEYVIASSRKIVEIGELDPNAVHLSGIFVDAIVKEPGAV